MARHPKDEKINWGAACLREYSQLSFFLFSLGDTYLRNFFLALQIFAAFFLTLFGLAELFHGAAADTGMRFVAALIAALGLTFLSLIGLNVKKARG